MLAITIISLVGLLLLAGLLFGAQATSKNMTNGANGLFALFYVVILFAAVTIVILYLK